MARFIPPFPSELSPFSEREVFSFLRDDPGAADWTILHSLGLPEHGKSPHGEIDFVVLIPMLGFVAVEVKGGELSCSNGVWQHTPFGQTQPKRYGRSPWMQAREGMYALKEYLERELGSAAMQNVGHAFLVVLPRTDEVPTTSEFNKWEVATRIDLDNKGIARCILDALRLTSKSTRRPAVGFLNQVRNKLRPDFDLIQSRPILHRETERHLIRFTQSQYRILDSFETNDRVIVSGAAGTGKTLVALEFARRQVMAGRSVGFFCYNKLLGSWLKQQAAQISEGLEKNEDSAPFVAGSMHGWLRSLISQNEELSPDFESDLRDSPEAFNDLIWSYGELAASEMQRKFDVIVVDEIQDLMAHDCLRTFDAILESGLAKGRWMFAGDFTRQSLFTAETGADTEEDFVSRLSEFDAWAVRMTLRLNCRNTKRIARHTITLSGFDQDPFELNTNEGLPVDVRYAASRDQAVEHVVTTFNKFLDDGLKSSDIVLLCNPNTVRSEGSIVSDLLADRRLVLQPWSLETKDEMALKHESLRRFKGLESAAVIVADIDDIQTDAERSLLYVAMSRARSRLVVVLPERVRPFAVKRISLAATRSLANDGT